MTVRSRLTGLLSWHGLSVLGAASAAVIVGSLNVLAARHPARFDWTREHLYTLSPATLGTLKGLSAPTDVVVFLGRSDPLRASVEQLLDGYLSKSPFLTVRYVDPDRNPGELLALQAKYSIEAGRADNGRVVTDAVIIVARGERHWYITHDDIVSYDEESGEATPRLERALTVGLRQVENSEPVSVCFTVGHEEISIEDVSPTGLAEIARRLEKDNYAVREVDLSANRRPDLTSCTVTVIAAPDVPLHTAATDALAERFKDGGRILVLAGAGLGETLEVEDRGIDRLTRSGGISLQNAVVLERLAESRLPEGVGETFFATPLDHAVTTALFRRGRPELYALVTLAQPLKAVDGPAVPQALLQSSPEAITTTSFRSVIEGTDEPTPLPQAPANPQVVAMAVELPEPQGGARLVRRMVVAPANVAFARNWRDPTMRGTALFFEGAFSWLAARPMLVDVPASRGQPVGLALTEADLAEVWRYVLLYMPGASAAFAALVLLRRRSSTSRREPRPTLAGQDPAKPERPQKDPKGGDGRGHT